MKKKVITEKVTMLQIKDTLISLDLIEEKFVCNLEKCFGECCVLGDAGAPLLEEEVEIINNNLEKVDKYLMVSGRKVIEKKGISTLDDSEELVTNLIDNKECVFTFFEDGVAKCAIEKAYENGEIDFKKPVSCHLYPVRLQKYNAYVAVNYSKWHICEHAQITGEKIGIPLYVFLKEPLIRRFGKDWYEELLLAAESLKETNNNL